MVEPSRAGAGPIFEGAPALLFTSVSNEDADRQQRYAQVSAQKISRQRSARVGALKAAEPAIDAAMREYRRVDHGDAPVIGIRRGFVRVDAEEITRRKELYARLMGGGSGVDSDDQPAELDGDSDEPPIERPDEPGGQSAAQAEGREIREASEEEVAKWRKAGHEGRPPLAKLMRRPHALRLLLSALYLAQVEFPGQYVDNRRKNAGKGPSGASWAVVAGLSGPSGKVSKAKRPPSQTRTRRLRVGRALDGLYDLELAQQRVRGRHEQWELLREDGMGGRYRPPRAGGPETLMLPAQFFLNGWHLVLSEQEIAMLLVLVDRDRYVRQHRSETEIDRDGVALPDRVKFSDYGISGETYEAVHQLDELDLVRLVDPMPHRRHGKIRVPTPEEYALAAKYDESLEPQPYHFKVSPLDRAFDRPAAQVMIAALLEYPLGKRLKDPYA